MTTHADHKYSVTIHTDDLPVAYCLRALEKYSQRTGNNNIPWGGTKDTIWERDGHDLTFRFSKPEYRNGFRAELLRLLPEELWSETSESDNDPACSQE